MASASSSPDYQLLGRSWLMGVLAPEDRAHLSGHFIERHFSKNQVVYVAGAPADSMLILASGELKVSSYSGDGTELILASVLPGETIGELGMLSDRPRSATVTAIQPSVGMMLSRVVVLRTIEQRPEVALALLQNLADRMRRMNGVAADLVFLDVHQRVAKFLIDNTQRGSNTVRVTQAHLAAAVGASRQRVNMCLQELQRQGWISIAAGAIRVVDSDSLRQSLED
jgi:CRP-like cAMP-binding protein